MFVSKEKLSPIGDLQTIPSINHSRYLSTYLTILTPLVDVLLHLEVDIVGAEVSSSSKKPYHIILLKTHNSQASRHDLKIRTILLLIKYTKV